jgi:MarR family 2-MHQ and catechol resistance regulon transcriptional repressor
VLKEEIKKRKPFESAGEEAYLNLLRTAGVLYADFERLFKGYGLSEPKYNVLRILRGAKLNGEFNGEGLPSLEIGDRMITRVPDITRLVDRLEAEGLVRRRRCEEDRRVVWVAITPRGLKLLDEMDEPVSRLHRQQFSHMTHEESVALSRLLEKVRDRPGVTRR